MAAAQLKDYYKILEVPPTAAVAEIKKAYRTLAFKYHPDTNPDNAYAATHFREVQEAWQVLQHEERRRNYDEERWLSGMSNRAKDQVIINPAWIYKESRKLSSHIATVDTYRMSHSALHDYIVLLLSDSHMAILQQSGEVDTNQSIVKELLTSTATLKYQYMEAIAPRLAVLAGGDEELLKKIQNQVSQSSRKARWERHQPLAIIAIALLLCVLMYLWVRIK